MWQAGPCGLDERHERVAVAVVADRAHRLGVAGRRPLVPQLPARAAPEVQLAGGARALERLGVHVRERQHLARWSSPGSRTARDPARRRRWRRRPWGRLIVGHRRRGRGSRAYHRGHARRHPARVRDRPRARRASRARPARRRRGPRRRHEPGGPPHRHRHLPARALRPALRRGQGGRGPPPRRDARLLRVQPEAVRRVRGEDAARRPARATRCPTGSIPRSRCASASSGLAAWLGLEWRGRLQRGETVLVLGASGVVGQIAVQAAQLLGAGRVVAAARNPEALERARGLGADAIVRATGDGRPGRGAPRGGGRRRVRRGARPAVGAARGGRPRRHGAVRPAGPARASRRAPRRRSRRRSCGPRRSTSSATRTTRRARSARRRPSPRWPSTPRPADPGRDRAIRAGRRAPVWERQQTSPNAKQVIEP